MIVDLARIQAIWRIVSILSIIIGTAISMRSKGITPKLYPKRSLLYHASNDTRPLVNQPSLTYLETMTAGAVSRAIAQTMMHPANTYKTILQLKKRDAQVRLTPERLLRGADAQFIMSIPHGAFYFCVVEYVKNKIEFLIPKRLQFLADFTSSTISTIVCSIVSTPQMVITDRLMAGIYPNFGYALKSIITKEGPIGFYAGWWPALAQKIPSYGFTWMFFQQLKRGYEEITQTKPSSRVSFILGAIASAASVCVMIPMDTVKTRLVIQQAGAINPYTGVSNCFSRILREEGVGALYRSLTPRLLSVVPMIAIQYGIYEYMKADFIRRKSPSEHVDRERSVRPEEKRHKVIRLNKNRPQPYVVLPYKQPSAKLTKKQLPRPALINWSTFSMAGLLGGRAFNSPLAAQSTEASAGSTTSLTSDDEA
jgi:Mitochondrial carrier protein